jgi:hypothetical protein
MRKVFRLLRIDLAIKKYKRAESQTLPPCINSSPKVGRTCPRTPCSSLFFRKKKKKKNSHNRTYNSSNHGYELLGR